MIRISALTATACLLLACETSTVSPLRPAALSAALREGVTKERFVFEIDDVFFSRCNLEDTHLTGTVRLTVTTTVEGSRTTIEVQDVETGMRAVGLSTGREYIYNLSGHFKDTFDSEAPFAFSFKANSRQITVVKGAGQFTRIQSVFSGYFDGTNTVINERRIVDECPGAETSQ